MADEEHYKFGMTRDEAQKFLNRQHELGYKEHRQELEKLDELDEEGDEAGYFFLSYAAVRVWDFVCDTHPNILASELLEFNLCGPLSDSEKTKLQERMRMPLWP